MRDGILYSAHAYTDHRPLLFRNCTRITTRRRYTRPIPSVNREITY